MRPSLFKNDITDTSFEPIPQALKDLSLRLIYTSEFRGRFWIKLVCFQKYISISFTRMDKPNLKSDSCVNELLKPCLHYGENGDKLESFKNTKYFISVP